MRAEKADAEAPSGMDESTQAEPATGGAPRVRRDFPETLLWVPELVTDDRGRAELTVPLADSITTWRLAMQAVTADGLIGSGERPIRVFQDFFVDLDLPAQLTRNDEIEIPAVVYNYLEREDEVRLVLEPGEGFEVLGPAEARLVLGAGEVRAAAFRVKAGKAGRWKLKLSGTGRGASDALEREAEVVPDGRAVVDSASDFLGRDPVELAFEVPPETVPGSQAVIVKFYPGPLTTAVEGLESLVRLPHG
jgi:uncharacterized protein YfaS (alpha-2-macroglobulin family)